MPRPHERLRLLAAREEKPQRLAVAGFIAGGFSVLAVFAVGAGHVALNQINREGGQGSQLARASLAVGYAIAIFGLLITVMSVLGLYT